MQRVRFSLYLILALFLASCAQHSGQPSEPPDTVPMDALASEYRIGVDDVVEVIVWKNPDLSVSMPVRPDGMISIPLIGDIKAGGKTAEQVAEEIRSGLSAYVRDPNVTVILTELRNNEYISRVRVTGAVVTPSSMPYRTGMTVLDAVLEAGGINEFASPDRAKLYRRYKGESSVLDVRLGGILNAGDLETNYPLRPGDIITVPERLF